MEKITVRKGDLIATIKANRATHRDEFLKAQDVYRDRVIDLLDQRLEQARLGSKIDLYFGLPEPHDYTDSYDTALEMLAWETGDLVEINQADFQRYVENKWEWRTQYAASTQVYLADEV